MPTPRSLRPIGHEDRLSLVDHLDELRSRLFICAGVLAVAFAFCFWQNHELLRIINKPLITQTRKQVAKGEGTVGQAVLAQQAIKAVARDTSRALEVLAVPSSGLPAHTRAQLAPLSAQLRRDIARLPKKVEGDKPVTLSVGEPFTTTITVAFYFALVLSLPVILYELFAFVLPAMAPNERRAVIPLLLAIPFLFVAGVLFGYFVVLPAAVRFFVNFNAGQFNNLVQANQFYKFAATILLAMGVVFQVPVVVISLTRMEIVTVAQLRHWRRYALVACAGVAAFLPGDFITLLLETAPLYLLYEVSILLASGLDRKKRRRERRAGNGDERDRGRAPARAGGAWGGRADRAADNRPHRRHSELMLFDLRGRGRRNTVRVLYIGLAILIGVGLVGFGVGGGFGGGGILSSAGNSEGSGGASFSSKISKYEKITKKEPNNVSAWENLAKNLLHEAGNEGFTNTETGAPTAKGKELYRRASQAWLSYLALNPHTPNSELAQLVYRIYSEEGLNEPAKAVQALNIVVTKRENASFYAQLAEYAYKAGNSSLGDLASAKAVKLAPAAERSRLKTELAEAKKFPKGGQIFTTTTNGKVYKIRKSPSGGYTAVGAPTPLPTTSTGATTGTTTGTTTGK